MAEKQLTNEELAEMLRKGVAGVKEFNAYAAEGRNVCFEKANCEEVNFCEVAFPDARFCEVNCTMASFLDAKLNGASFKKATCVATAFTDADLSLVNFEEADLAEACLTGTILEYAIFQDAYIDTANFAGAKRLDPELRCQIIKTLLQSWEEQT